jgi:hypothetical protein
MPELYAPPSMKDAREGAFLLSFRVKWVYVRSRTFFNARQAASLFWHCSPTQIVGKFLPAEVLKTHSPAFIIKAGDV